MIRNAPGATHIMAVVDGQAKKSYENLLKLLNTKVSEIYPTYGHVFEQLNPALLNSFDLIPLLKMTQKTHSSESRSLGLFFE